jgi:hypothetical protein
VLPDASEVVLVGLRPLGPAVGGSVVGPSVAGGGGSTSPPQAAKRASVTASRMRVIRPALAEGLPGYFESEVGSARCLDRTEPPQFDPLRIESLEEPDAAAEE